MREQPVEIPVSPAIKKARKKRRKKNLGAGRYWGGRKILARKTFSPKTGGEKETRGGYLKKGSKDWKKQSCKYCWRPQHGKGKKGYGYQCQGGKGTVKVAKSAEVRRKKL